MALPEKKRIVVGIPDWVTTLPLRVKANNLYILTDDNENVKIIPFIPYNPITQEFELPPVTIQADETMPVAAHNGSITGAGPLALWTPAAGKKFQILGGVIIVLAGLLAAGNEVISFLDAATDIGLDFTVYIPIAASIGTVASVIPFTLGENGILSATAGNALNVTVGTAVTAGSIGITVWGYEV